MTSKKSDRLGIGMKIFAILLVSLVATVSAQDSGIFDLSSEWVVVSGMIILIAFSILGTAYMVSKVFGIPQWEAWVREESVNVLFSAAIIIMFTAFAGVIEGVADDFASEMLSTSSEDLGTIALPRDGSVTNAQISYWNYNKQTGRWYLSSTPIGDCPYPCHFYIARAFLGSSYERYGQMLKVNAKTLGGSRLLESSAIGFGIGLTIYMVDIQMALAFPLYASRAIFNNTLETVVQGLISVVSMLKAQEIMLAFMPGLAGVFFIVGILSRIMWFLRKFGGLLVALAIGIYVIFPLIYVLGWYTVDRSIAVATLEFLPTAEQGQSLVGSLGNPGGAKTEIFFSNFDEIGRAPSRIGLLDAYGRSAIIVILIPMIAVFTTIGFVRHFSPMIGGDPELAGLTRII